MKSAIEVMRNSKQSTTVCLARGNVLLELGRKQTCDVSPEK